MDKLYMVQVRDHELVLVCAQPAWGEATYRFVELHLLLQVQADDAVVVIDAVTMEVIHLSYNQNRDVSQYPHKTPNDNT